MYGFETRRSLFPTLMIILLSVSNSYVVFAARNAYDILGVPRSASQDEIRKHYKARCLELHPDKTVHLALKERIKREEEFKEVQEAHSLIGDETSRRNYDFSERYGGGFGQSYNHSSSTSGAYDNIYRTYSFQFGRPQTMFDMGFRPRNFADQTFGMSSIHSIYVETVKVPLSELYTGVRKKKVKLHDTWNRRYRAAFRGGVGQQVALQSCASFVTMLLRSNVLTSAIISIIIFHNSLPKPIKREFVVELKKGWKGGTKLKFDHIEPGISIVFVLEEKPHKRFKRIDNDLHTDVIIGVSKAQKGCTLLIDPLADYELPIEVKIKSGDIDYLSNRTQTIKIPGRGWPKNDDSRGDLVIHIKVVSDKAANKYQKKLTEKKLNEGMTSSKN